MLLPQWNLESLLMDGRVLKSSHTNPFSIIWSNIRIFFVNFFLVNSFLVRPRTCQNLLIHSEVFLYRAETIFSHLSLITFFVLIVTLLLFWVQIWKYCPLPQKPHETDGVCLFWWLSVLCWLFCSFYNKAAFQQIILVFTGFKMWR